MGVAQLLEPILTGGTRDTNFFNGRILTADDLRTMQGATRQHDAQLGRATGAGVVHGFNVTLVPVGSGLAEQNIVVNVTSGLALNLRGETVALSSSVDVRLIVGDEATAGDGAFAFCQPPSAEFTNAGFYVLTVMPSAGLEGRAPMTQPGAEGIASQCASRYVVEGVKFSLVRVTLAAAAAPGSLMAQLQDVVARLARDSAAAGREPLINPDLSFARNAFAHLCYGSESREEMTRDPLARLGAQGYGLLDALRDQKLLTNCEVPIGVILWRPEGVQFVDAWATKRPVAPAARRRLAEGWAMFRQFQDQIEELFRSGLTTTDLVAVTARERFRFLPPVGVLPAAAPGVRGFTVERFLSGMTRRAPEFIDGALLDSLLWSSFLHEPVDVNDAEMVWVYQVWQNAFAQTQGQPPQPYFVFASAHVPYLGPSRFDVARWDYSNCASGANRFS